MATGAHDTLIATTHQLGDALEIESLARIRLTDEYDAAQKRGEVATVGQPKSIVDDGNDKPTAADLGLRRVPIHRWRKRLKDEPATAYELSARVDNLSFKHLGCMSP